MIGVWRAAGHRHPLGASATSRPFSTCTTWPIPGNVGTVLRAAQAFGAGPVRAEPADRGPVRPEGGAREHGRGLRAAASSRADFEEARAALRPARDRARARARAGRCASSSSTDPSLFVLGAERAGLPPELVAACDEIAHVPLGRGGADSLNVAMTATLCLYEYRATPCLTRRSTPSQAMERLGRLSGSPRRPSGRCSRPPPPAELEELRVRYLGRKAELTQILRSIPSSLPEERRARSASAATRRAARSRR